MQHHLLHLCSWTSRGDPGCAAAGSGGAGGHPQSAGHRAGVVIGIIVLVAAILGLLGLGAFLLVRWRRRAGAFRHSRFTPEDDKARFELPPTSAPAMRNGH